MKNRCGSDLTLAQGFLESLALMPRGKPGDSKRQYVLILLPGLDTAMFCAKAFQKATKAHPSYATQEIRFELDEVTSIPAAAEAMLRILAVIRGTYLLTCGSVALRELGLFRVRYEDQYDGSFISGEVQADVREGVIETALVGEGSRKVLHRDPWNSAT